MNFSDLASIGAGGVEAMSIEAGLFAAPAGAEDAVVEQADSEGSEAFAALLGLLVGPPPLLPPPEVPAVPFAAALVAAEITPELIATVKGGSVPMVADDRGLRSRETVPPFALPFAAAPVPREDLTQLPSAAVDAAAFAAADPTADVPAVDVPTVDVPTVDVATGRDVPTGAVGPLPFLRVQPVRGLLDRIEVTPHPKSVTAPPAPLDQARQAEPTVAERGPTIDQTMPGEAPVALAHAERQVGKRDRVDHADTAQVPDDRAASPTVKPEASPVLKPAPIVQAVAQVEAATRAAVGPAPDVEPAVSPLPITPPAQAPTSGGGEAFARDDAPGQPGVPRPVQAVRAVAVVADVPVMFADALQAPTPVAPAAPAWLPVGGEIDELPDLTPQIIHSVRMQVAGEVGQARVHLRPEHLGELVVDLRVDQGDVIATIRSDVPEVREWIQARSEELRSALGASGLTLVHVSVNERDARKGKGQEAEVKDGAKGRKSKDREEGRVFEIAA